MRLGHRREGGPPVEVRAVLLDIDGMLTVSWKPLPGAVEAVRALRDAGLRLALLTNTTSRTPSIAGHVRRPVGPRDDVEADVVGGQAAGLTGVLVRTGKFQPAAEEG